MPLLSDQQDDSRWWKRSSRERRTAAAAAFCLAPARRIAGGTAGWGEREGVEIGSLARGPLLAPASSARPTFGRRGGADPADRTTNLGTGPPGDLEGAAAPTPLGPTAR
jgi:hypothetical protein